MKSSSSWLNNSFSSAAENLKGRWDEKAHSGDSNIADAHCERKMCQNISVMNRSSKLTCSRNNVSSRCSSISDQNNQKVVVKGLGNNSLSDSLKSSDRMFNVSTATTLVSAPEHKRTCDSYTEPDVLPAKKSKMDDLPAMTSEGGHTSFMESDTLLESIDLMFEEQTNANRNIETDQENGEVKSMTDGYEEAHIDSPEIFEDSESFTLSQLGFSQRLSDCSVQTLPFIRSVQQESCTSSRTDADCAVGNQSVNKPCALGNHCSKVPQDNQSTNKSCVINDHCAEIAIDNQSCATDTVKLENCDKGKCDILENCDTPDSVSIRWTEQKVCMNNGTPMSGSSFEFIIDSNGLQSHNLTEQRSRGCISSKLKQRLQNNARADTPVMKSRLSAIITNKTDDTKSASDKKNVIITPANNIGWCGEFDVGPFYGLPSKVQQLLKSHRSINDLYDWQKECLSMDAARNGRNLIYALPTSGGKTLVAELLIFQQLLCKQKDALFILPFVAIVQEKVRGLSPFAVGLDFIVEEYAASKGTFPPRRRLRRKSVYIATIEKANSLVNSLIEAQRIDQLGLVVVDELHMLGESGSRGALLEMTLTKLLYVSPRTQIVGMSATLSNIDDLQKFLKAELYTNDFRPVELKEYVKLSDVLYEIDTKALCDEDRFKFSKMISFPTNDERKRLDPDQLIDLVLEVVPQHSCLIFCPTKKNCENVAQLLCKLMPRNLREVKLDERRSLRSALQNDCAGKICPILRETVMYGIAYHHSGLTMDERRLLEEAYLDGVLCVLACTSTLAAGVNLPAKRVILRSPYVGLSFISRSQYKQMVGRAGRAGLDSSGESILILTNKDKNKLTDLITSSQANCLSNLVSDSSKGLRSILLAGIALKMLNVRDDIERLLSNTLCYIQQDKLEIDMKEMSRKALQQLVSLGLVVQKVDSTASEENQVIRLDITTLGNAVCKGSIDIDYGERLYTDLQETQKCLVVDNYLHLLYLVTPYDMIDKVNIDWMLYHREVGTLSASELRVASAVGVSEGLLVKRASGLTARGVKDELAISRFYQTLMLLQLWKQKSIWDVAAHFKQPRGFIQQLLSSAGAFAACVLHFCRELVEFWAYQDLLENFVKKLSYCCSSELLPLMEIPGVKIGRARQLYSAGLTTLQHIARADPEHLVKSIENMPRRAARLIITSAQMLLKEKAEALKEEAEILMTVADIS